LASARACCAAALARSCATWTRSLAVAGTELPLVAACCSVSADAALRDTAPAAATAAAPAAPAAMIRFDLPIRMVLSFGHASARFAYALSVDRGGEPDMSRA